MQLLLYRSLAHADFSDACRRLAENRFGDLKIDARQKLFLFDQLIRYCQTIGHCVGRLKPLFQEVAAEREKLRLAISISEKCSPDDLQAEPVEHPFLLSGRPFVLCVEICRQRSDPSF